MTPACGLGSVANTRFIGARRDPWEPGLAEADVFTEPLAPRTYAQLGGITGVGALYRRATVWASKFQTSGVQRLNF